MSAMGEIRPGPDAVQVDLRRASVATVAVGGVLLAALTFFAWYGVATTPDRTTAWIAGFFGVFFGGLLLMILLAVPRMVRRRGLAFDRVGIHVRTGDTVDVVAWPEIARAGIAYELPPDVPHLDTSLQDVVTSLAEDQLQKLIRLDKRRRVALEIYPVDPVALDHHPGLVDCRRPDRTPPPGLPPARWRIPLPPAFGTFRAVERGGAQFGVPRWVGWVRRPWTGGVDLTGRRPR